MPRLNVRQVYEFVKGGGFEGTDAFVMTAIVMAESGGDTNAVNPGGTGVGLFQINPKAHGTDWNLRGKDPAASAAFAYSLYQGRGGTTSARKFDDWEAFTNGAYKAKLLDVAGGLDDRSFLQRVQDFPSNAWNDVTSSAGDLVDGVTGILDPIEKVANALSDIAKFPLAIYNWVTDRDNIFRIVKIAVGGTILVVGFNMLGKPITEPVKAAKDATIGKAKATALTAATGGASKAASAGSKAASTSSKTATAVKAVK